MLSYTRFGDPAAVRWIAIAHGILGSGKNWRSFARVLCERTGWGAIAVDLRMHGGSSGFTPPHTIATAAADVVELAAALAHQGRSIAALCGHSFGGKVLTAARPELDLPLWLIDSSPSARSGVMDGPLSGAPFVLQELEAIGDRFASRDDFVGALVDGGVARSVGQWLALNLRRDDGGYRLALDLEAIRSLLADYFATDTWNYLETGPVVNVAIAGRGSAFDESDLDRLAELERRGRVRCHRFADAGHWIHVDARDALLDALVSGLNDHH